MREILTILVDKRIPELALECLGDYGDVIPFETSGITYEAISGHPDIFFCQTKEELVIAPNLPMKIKKRLIKNGISFAEGHSHIGLKYPLSSQYNALISDKYLVHNPNYTDRTISSNSKHLHLIEVKQAYTRCNVLALTNDRFITSDRGIEKAMQGKGLEVLYVDPKGILLPGFKNGFFGGACGIHSQRVFFIGKLDHFPEGEKVKKFIEGYEIIELYDGPLFDGGSILFID